MQGVTVFNKQENGGFQSRILLFFLFLLFFFWKFNCPRMHVYNNPIKKPTLNKVAKNIWKLHCQENIFKWSLTFLRELLVYDITIKRILIQIMLKRKYLLQNNEIFIHFSFLSDIFLYDNFFVHSICENKPFIIVEKLKWFHPYFGFLVEYWKIMKLNAQLFYFNA